MGPGAVDPCRIREDPRRRVCVWWTSVEAKAKVTRSQPEKAFFTGGRIR